MAVVILIMSIIFLSPVDPARLTFGQRIDQSMLEQKQKALGLDQPLTVQLRYYLRDVLPVYVGKQLPEHLNPYTLTSVKMSDKLEIAIKKPYLRESYQTGRAVVSMIGQVLPSTLILASVSILLGLSLGMLLGVIAAYNKGNWLDQMLIGVSTLGYSVPSYVSAIFFALIFGYYLHSVTGLNLQGGLFTINDIGDEVVVLKNLILPSIALGIRPVSVILQITRSSVLETLDKPFVLLAVAKGLPKRLVQRRYVLRNSLNPVITATSGWFASLLGGAFFVETVFNFRGFGQLTVNALINYDVPLLLGCILTVSTMFILVNLLVDRLYSVIDPRVRV